MICERCGKEHDGTFGSGRFCSKSCAQSRTWSKEHKHKLSESLKQSEKVTGAKTRTYKCISCGDEYKGYNRYKKCPDCRKKIGRIKDISTINSIKKLSKRTVSKLLKRAEKECVLCGWNVATCDIHHIVERSNGGSDDHDNLVVVCPNCHRSIHCLGEEFVSNEELVEKSILFTFSDWRNYYHPSN